MKPHSHHSSAEQKADTLWKQFNPDDQERFWEKYEGLLTQDQIPPQVSFPNTFLITPNARVFKPSISNYAQTAAMLVFSLLFLLSFGGSTGQSSGSDFFMILVFFFLLMVFFETWKLNKFYAEETFLGIRNKFSFKKEYIVWKDIDSMGIFDRKSMLVNNATYRELEVKTRFGEIHKFRFPLSSSSQREFISLVKSKNILITDNSGKGVRFF